MESEKSNNICKRCHRKLKDDKSVELGFGPTCYQKYLQSKKTYLFDMNERNDYMFTHEDLIKFYQLLIRYDITSPNIGVVSKKKFDDLVKLFKKQLKQNPNLRLLLNEEHTKLTLIENEIEVSYILIQEPKDLVGKYFRKYI